MDRDRLAHIDGLRGLAVGLVVVFHSWSYLHTAGSPLFRAPQGATAQYFGALGQQGVSLFLVLSGFCLSLSLWARREAGEPRWFVPSHFFARRSLRILPPYFVALALFTALSLVGGSALRHALYTLGHPVTPWNVLTHVLLIHNLTPDLVSINGVFWSLGLEWQWYWVFPIVVMLCVRRPWHTVLAALLLAFIWLDAAQWAWTRWHVGNPYFLYGPIHPLLPQRLFEFTVGVVVARLALGRPRLPRWLPLLAVVCVLFGWQDLLTHNLQELAGGAGFGLLVLSVCGSEWLRRAFSWRPLVQLGVISYSVYLVHEPVLQGTELLASRVSAAAVPLMLVGIMAGVAAGLAFHVLVERRCMSRAAWERWSPWLLRMLSWTDWVYAVVGGEDLPRVSVALGGGGRLPGLALRWRRGRTETEDPLAGAPSLQ